MKNTGIKELIISKTKELIRHDSNLTIKDISEACFINIASVNYYFGCKDNLFAIVLGEIVEELKESIIQALKCFDEKDEVKILEKMIRIIFHFTNENPGVINYLFIDNDNLEISSNILMEAFFTNNPFTKMIINEIERKENIKDELLSKARYTLLFSCFIVPIFLQNNDIKIDDEFLASFSNPEFLQIYINEMLKIIR